ncbi:hypothetical protein EOI86_07940 [Hwanghaeella grinnelliae]|uniref:Lipoprotein n=1 Tax=Hwanghaeella grinnelliae TaxID=2500179 RepID=A0A437QXA3_9PROT|nr:hypothetical protein [Hwanghaeella grinnelliae]RVU39170.1 hypothetical protein EOI86_07940 [Hwanghaeella grinnelliae]
MTRAVAFAVAATMLVACARNAPALPKDSSSINAEGSLSTEDFSDADIAMSCEQIDVEQDRIRTDAAAYGQEIAKNRGQNQAAGYVAGVLFPPALLATVHNDAEKAELDALQARFDVIQALKRVKNCPSKLT